MKKKIQKFEDEKPSLAGAFPKIKHTLEYQSIRIICAQIVRNHLENKTPI